MAKDTNAQDLDRTLDLFPATNIVVANMVGAGIFTTGGLLLGEIGDPLLMIALWGAGGVLALCGALCYGELGAAMPRAGGEYAYLTELFHPLPGFLTGWVSFFVGFSAPLAAASLGFAEYLASAFPAAVAWGPPGLIQKLVACAVVVVLTLVHMRGLEFGARVQNYLTVGKVALIAVLVAAGFAFGRGDVEHFRQSVDLGADAGGWRSAGLALMWIMFAYSGWNASTYVGSEIRDPGRNLPRSLLLGTVIVIVLYFGLNALWVYAAAPAELSGVIAVGGVAAKQLFGPWAETAVSSLIAFALLSSISALIILGPRVYYAMAKDGAFFRFAARVNPDTRVPSTSIVLQSAIAVVMVLSGSFDQILTYMGFCLGIFPLVAVAGVFKLDNRRRIPLYPLTPLVFMAGSVLILVLAYMERPVESSVAVATVLLGLPAYLYFRRRGQ